MRRIRLSYTQIQRLRRCPWAWHARHVRGLVPLRRRRPPPAWGDAYHAAAAAVWRWRAVAEQSGHWLDGRDMPTTLGLADAAAKLATMDLVGVDEEALAREAAQAAVEVCASVGPEWRVLWLDGAPVVEREITVPIGRVVCPKCHGHNCPHCGGSGMIEVDLLCVLDLALVHRDTGVVRVVDHKTTSSWPEDLGDAPAPGADLVGLDLRDDLQVRLYVWALRQALEDADAMAVARGVQLRRKPAPVIEGGHLVRRASVGEEPPVLKRGSLSRAQTIEATEEQWLRAIRRHGLRVEDYEAELARARLIRWHAWAPCEFTPRSLELARREALQAAEDVARYGALEADDVPRFRLPGRWQPSRPQKWSGLAPKTGAEVFAWSACAACDHRDLCVAEAQGHDEEAALIRAGQFADPDVRQSSAHDACSAEADEVD